MGGHERSVTKQFFVVAFAARNLPKSGVDELHLCAARYIPVGVDLV
jgi:hypothetical protein